MSLSKGKIIIAEPFLGDKNFERSVAILCEHNEQGSFGLVLNQQTNLKVYFFQMVGLRRSSDSPTSFSTYIFKNRSN